MKKIMTLIFAGALVGVLCTACDEPKANESAKLGTGNEIPGIKTEHGVKGTIIGSYSNGFGSLLVQVDEGYPIGRQLEYFDATPCTYLPKENVYNNMIQVQCKLPSEIRNNKISFSCRIYQGENDVNRELFIIGNGLGNAMCMIPNVPIYVITDYEILNN
jgi:hypothetical protein